ncbi:recombinase family protein [Belnapia moabensis]|uniref:recombinase family protein n=1 Tax=Belnapia moabensis TaxID=365533 RepID=UPI0005BB1982|nr:recombinase family protein [Belnapia moabensis]
MPDEISRPGRLHNHLPEALEPQVYGYVRFSSPDQREGDSERRQRTKLEAYAASVNLPLNSDYADLGLSGFTGKHISHGALGRFVEAVANGEIASGSHLVFEAFDRMSRQEVDDAQDLFKALLKRGIIIHTLEDGRTYTYANTRNNLVNLIYPIMMMHAAHNFSARLSGRMLEATDEKRRLLREKNYTKSCPGWLKPKPNGRGFEFYDLERVGVIRMIHELYVEHDMGCDYIAAVLNENGIPTFDYGGKRARAAGWHRHYVWSIITNRAVIGEFQPNHRNAATGGKSRPIGDPEPDYYPAAIEMEVWNRTQAMRESRKGTGGPKGTRIANLFSGYVFCALCGGKGSVSAKGDRRRKSKRVEGEPRLTTDYFICENAKRCIRDPDTQERLCNNQTMMRYEPVEAEVLRVIGDTLPVTKTQDRNPEIAALEEEIARLRVVIDRERKGISRLTSLLGDDDPETELSIKANRRRIDEAQKQIAVLKRELVPLRGRQPIPKGAAVVRELKAAHASADPTVRKDAWQRISAALRSIIDRVEIDTPQNYARVTFAGDAAYLEVKDGRDCGVGVFYPRLEAEEPAVDRRTAERLKRLRAAVKATEVGLGEIMDLSRAERRLADQPKGAADDGITVTVDYQTKERGSDRWLTRKPFGNDDPKPVVDGVVHLTPAPVVARGVPKKTGED